MKKKYFVFILSILFYVLGCENLPDEVIENKSVNYRILNFNAPNIVDQKNNSLFQFSVTLDNAKDIENITYIIKDELNEKIKRDNLDANQNNHGTFVGKYNFANNTVKGNLVLSLIVNDVLGESAEIIRHNFFVTAPNSIPVISNLNIYNVSTVVDTSFITVVDTFQIKMSVKVSDNDGLNDIENVYFKITKPNGTSSGNKISLYDDGNKQLHNDEIARDGIYSVIIQVFSSNTKGKYKFEFFAEDKNNAVSNPLVHFLEIL